MVKLAWSEKTSIIIKIKWISEWQSHILDVF